MTIEARWPGATCRLDPAVGWQAGLEDRHLTAAVRGGVLLRLRRGAYVRSSQWNQIKPWERDSLQYPRALRSHGRTAACYSHISAARLQCLPESGTAGRWCTSPPSYANSSTSTGPDVRTHRFALDASEVVTLQTADGREFSRQPPWNGPCSTAHGSCCRPMPPPSSATHALRKGADLRHDAAGCLRNSDIKRGSRRAAAVLDSLDGRAESAGETRTRLLLRSFGCRRLRAPVRAANDDLASSGPTLPILPAA